MALQRTQSLSTSTMTATNIAGHIGRKGELIMVNHNGVYKLHLMDGITPGGLLLDTSSQRPKGGGFEPVLSPSTMSVEYLVIAGGGGGGGDGVVVTVQLHVPS